MVQRRQASRHRSGAGPTTRPQILVAAALLALAIPLASCGGDPSEPPGGTGPDLTVVGVEPSQAEVFRGSVLDVVVTVRNAGDAPAPAGWDWTLGLSQDQGFDATDTEIESGSWNSSLAPDGTSSLDVDARVPASVPADTYHLVVALDPSGSLDRERDPANNTGSSAEAVAVRIPHPDLVAEAITAAPSTVAPGDSVGATLEVVNSGQAPAPRGWSWALYLSADEALDDADRVLASGIWTDPLDVGQVGSRVVESRIPTSVPTGDYRVLAELDVGNDVDEGGGEANNAAASTSVVTVSPPENGMCPIPALPDSSEVDLSTDVTFAVMGGEPLRLDVASPPATGDRPMVLALHGGSWRAGDKSARRNLILRLANAGYVAASANYRLADAPENIFPAAVADVRCAVRWMKANAASLGGDAGRVVAVGTSAGGHLASMLATAPERDELDGAGDCGISGAPSVQGAASFYGVYDLRSSAPGIEDSTEIGSVMNFLGGHPDDIPERAAAASPVVHLEGGDPPFLVSYGLRDQRAFRLQGDLFADSLALRGVSGELVTVDAGHGYRPLSDDPELAASSCALLDFLDDVVGQP